MILYPDPKKGTLTATVTNFDWGIQMMSKNDYLIIISSKNSMPLYKFQNQHGWKRCWLSPSISRPSQYPVPALHLVPFRAIVACAWPRSSKFVQTWTVEKNKGREYGNVTMSFPEWSRQTEAIIIHHCKLSIEYQLYRDHTWSWVLGHSSKNWLVEAPRTAVLPNKKQLKTCLRQHHISLNHIKSRSSRSTRFTRIPSICSCLLTLSKSAQCFPTPMSGTTSTSEPPGPFRAHIQ